MGLELEGGEDAKQIVAVGEGTEDWWWMGLEFVLVEFAIQGVLLREKKMEERQWPSAEAEIAVLPLPAGGCNCEKVGGGGIGSGGVWDDYPVTVSAWGSEAKTTWSTHFRTDTITRGETKVHRDTKLHLSQFLFCFLCRKFLLRFDSLEVYLLYSTVPYLKIEIHTLYAAFENRFSASWNHNSSSISLTRSSPPIKEKCPTNQQIFPRHSNHGHQAPKATW
jgi:hypothetical protein